VLPAFGNSQDLRDIEVRLEQAPDDIGLLFARACMLDMLGRNDDARDAYIAVIRRDGTHLGALTNFGTLLYNAGIVVRSITAFACITSTRESRCRTLSSRASTDAYPMKTADEGAIKDALQSKPEKQANGRDKYLGKNAVVIVEGNRIVTTWPTSSAGTNTSQGSNSAGSGGSGKPN
jgi:hypothetical protein